MRCWRQRWRGGERRGGGRHRQAVVGREAYYTRELAENHEAYLSGHGESPGRWYGAGATEETDLRPSARGRDIGCGGQEAGRHGGAVRLGPARLGRPWQLSQPGTPRCRPPARCSVVGSGQYSGRLQLDSSGRLWHGRYPSPPHCARCRSRPTGPPGSCPTARSDGRWREHGPLRGTTTTSGEYRSGDSPAKLDLSTAWACDLPALRPCPSAPTKVQPLRLSRY